jgi:S1-C subfamily serine protease
MKGELVGLTTMASSPAGFDAMAGYAIPMDRIGRRAVEALKQGKEVEYGLLGVRPHLESTNRIESVAPNSPAALGDLQRNDEIIAVNGVPVVDFDSLILAVGAYGAGDEVRLLIRREGREIEKPLVLAKYPVDGEVIATNRPPAWRGLRVDYLSMLNSRQAARLAIDAPPSGVIVREVEPDSPAARAGLKPWQVIQQAGDRPVPDPSRFARAVEGLDGPVTLQTDRGPVVVQP